MSAGDETYVLNAFKAAQAVEEMWTFDGLTSRQIEELYRRNPLAPGGYESIYINSAVLVPDVTIVSVTEPAVEGEDVTVVATTPAGALTYKFELEFSTGNWLTVQDSSSNTWAPAIGTDGFFWRAPSTPQPIDPGPDRDSQTREPTVRNPQHEQ